MRTSCSSSGRGRAGPTGGTSPAEAGEWTWVSHARPRLADGARVPRPDFAVTAAGGVRRLGVLREVEASHLGFLADPEPHDGVKNLQDDERPHEGQHPGRDDGDDLGLHLPRVAVEEAVCSVGIDRLEDSRSEEHTSELQSPCNLVCRLLLEKKKQNTQTPLPLTMS